MVDIIKGLKSLKAIFSRVEAPSEPKEPSISIHLQQNALDKEALGDYYQSDERQVELFQDIAYSENRKEWVARFTPTDPKSSSLSISEGNYIEVLEFARLLHESKIKPSQSCKALLAFDAHIDCEAAKLVFPIPCRSEMLNPKDP